MSEESKKLEEERMTAGVMVIIGNTVEFDSEAKSTGTPSKVGQKFDLKRTLPPLVEDDD